MGREGAETEQRRRGQVGQRRSRDGEAKKGQRRGREGVETEGPRRGREGAEKEQRRKGQEGQRRSRDGGAKKGQRRSRDGAETEGPRRAEKEGRRAYRHRFDRGVVVEAPSIWVIFSGSSTAQSWELLSTIHRVTHLLRNIDGGEPAIFGELSAASDRSLLEVVQGMCKCPDLPDSAGRIARIAPSQRKHDRHTCSHPVWTCIEMSGNPVMPAAKGIGIEYFQPVNKLDSGSTLLLLRVLLGFVQLHSKCEDVSQRK